MLQIALLCLLSKVCRYMYVDNRSSRVINCGRGCIDLKTPSKIGADLIFECYYAIEHLRFLACFSNVELFTRKEKAWSNVCAYYSPGDGQR